MGVPNKTPHKMRALSVDEVNSMVTKEKKDDTIHRTRWPNKTDKATLLATVKKTDQELVTTTLSCGRKFVIYINPAAKDLFYVKLLSKMGPPCGWFRVSKLASELQEQEVVDEQ